MLSPVKKLIKQSIEECLGQFNKNLGIKYTSIQNSFLVLEKENKDQVYLMIEKCIFEKLLKVKKEGKIDNLPLLFYHEIETGFKIEF